MAKLIYAKSRAGFDTAYTDKTSIDKSIAFIEDGWLWTHGKYFKIFPDATPLLTTTTDGSIVTVKDGNGKELFSIDRGVLSISGDTIISATNTNGAVALTHSKPFTLDQTVGPTANSSTSIYVPQITFDQYGHYKNVTNRTATLNQVAVTNVDSSGSTMYLVGSATNPTSTSEALNKTSKITFVPTSGTLNATLFVENGTSLSAKYAPLSHIDVSATGSTLGHVTLSDSTTSTSGTASGVAATPLAVKTVMDYAQNIIAAGDAMIFKGTIGSAGTITGSADVNGLKLDTLPTYNAGWTFKIAVAQTITGIGSLEVGDMVVAINDKATTYNTADWTVIQTNIDGAVISTATLTNDQLILGAGNKSIKSLAAGTNGQYLMANSSGIPTWTTVTKTYRAVSVNGTAALSDTDLTTLALKNGTGVSLSWNSTNKELTVATSLQNLAIQNSGTAVGNYVPSGATNNTINFGTGLTASLASNVFTVNHSNSVTEAPTTAVRSFTYDANGHVTGSTVITSLPTPQAITFSDSATTPVTASFTGSNPLSVKFAPATGDIKITASTSTNAITYTLGLTHKYRAISYKPSLGGATTAIYNDTTAGTLTISPGNSNVSMSVSGGELSISSVNTWRNVSAYGISNTLTEVLSSIGTDDLQFGSEFLWDSTNVELKLGWAEVSTSGAITYAF